MTSWIKPIQLSNQWVILEPLSLDHLSDLMDAVEDGELYKLWYTHIAEPSEMRTYIEQAMDMAERGEGQAFAIRDIYSGKIVGSSRYCHADTANQRLEIGYTWYAKSVQKTALNTACKLLMLEHAFEILDCIAVEFRTHWHNQNSRNAIAKLGAKQDAVLRNHQKMPNGGYRDTVVFSIIDSEWPVVKQSLAFRLERLLEMNS